MEAADTLRINTAGSVDDGKSTLIGRLLFDAHGILQDQLSALESATRRHGHVAGGERHDFSLLTDGLIAEREQGITIDVAYRYFSTATRRYILADTPGHEQYTRNMVTGASTADVAIVLVDAKRGLTRQTHRHLAIASLLGIPQVVVAVNKMDLVGYAQSAFEQMVAEVQALAKACGLINVSFIPVSALTGEMVVKRGVAMPWYAGPTLLEALEASDAHLQQPRHLRVPIQGVSKSKFGVNNDLRGYWGTLLSGSLAVGDKLTLLPSQQRATVAELVRVDSAGQVARIPSAEAGEAVTVVLAEQVELSRGSWLTNSAEPQPALADAFVADVCWFGSEPLVLNQRYWLKHGTQMTRAIVEEVQHVLDVGTLLRQTDGALPVTMNTLARVKLSVQSALVVEAYQQHREMGCFILIDDTTHRTTAAGMIAIDSPSP